MATEKSGTGVGFHANYSNNGLFSHILLRAGKNDSFAITVTKGSALLHPKNSFLNLNPGQPRTLLPLKLVGILTINLFLT
jgi:hypothetical protein